MKLTPIKGVFALLAGAIILKIFFPWWFVTLVIGGTTCFALYKWVIVKTGVSPGWAKTLAGAAIFVFCISLLLTYIEAKWPWVAKAFDSRQLVTSFGVADWLNPKYPADLSMKLAKFKELKVKAEEQKYIKKIEAIEAKIAAGKDLSPEDEKVVKEAEDKLKELDKKMSEIHLSRPPSSEKKAPMPQNTGKQNISQQKQEIKAKYVPLRFPVRAGEPSAVFAFPKDQCCWANWWGPDETQIITKDGQIMGSLFKEYGVRKEFSEGIRFQSPVDGIVLVFQASKKEDLPSIGQVKEMWQKEQNAYFRAKQNSEQSSEPQKPVELVYLGRDLKYLKFEENEYIARSPAWIIKLVSVKIVENGYVKLEFLHRAAKSENNSRPGLIGIVNPEETTFLTDVQGRTLRFVREKNLNRMIGKNGSTVIGKDLPSEVPVAYHLIFGRLPDNIKEINFITKMSWCSYFSSYGNTCQNSKIEDVVIRRIKLFKEKSQVVEDKDTPDEKESAKSEPGETSLRTSAKEVTEGRVAEEESTQRQRVSEEKKPSQPTKSIGRQIFENVLRGGQRSERYPYRRN